MVVLTCDIRVLAGQRHHGVCLGITLIDLKGKYGRIPEVLFIEPQKVDNVKHS
jgi:hypothetical protein